MQDKASGWKGTHAESGLLDRILGNVAGLNAKLPDGDDPFQIMTRLCEEAGELAQAVNHTERSGTKVEKYDPPDLAHLADEVHHVLRAALAIATHRMGRTGTADCRRRGNAVCTTYKYVALATMMWHLYL
jgi:NTP pyrophosphatase (non-canonical NTP hydrolase)